LSILRTCGRAAPVFALRRATGIDIPQ